MIEEMFKILAKKENGWSPKNFPDRIVKKSFPDFRRNGCHWQFFLNGNNDKKTVTADQWGKIELLPYGGAIFWNGWLAGVFDITGGEIAAHPEGANAETFLTSLRKAT